LQKESASRDSTNAWSFHLQNRQNDNKLLIQ